MQFLLEGKYYLNYYTKCKALYFKEARLFDKLDNYQELSQIEEFPWMERRDLKNLSFPEKFMEMWDCNFCIKG